jgi:hypothetical protein
VTDELLIQSLDWQVELDWHRYAGDVVWRLVRQTDIA